MEGLKNYPQLQIAPFQAPAIVQHTQKNTKWLKLAHPKIGTQQGLAEAFCTQLGRIPGGFKNIRAKTLSPSGIGTSRQFRKHNFGM